MEQITSTKNPKIKRLVLLQQKSQERKREGVFVVEGRREIEHCAKIGYDIESIYELEPSAIAPNAIHYQVSKEVYQRIAYREGTEGIVAVVRAQDHSLQAMTERISVPNPVYVILESVEKPGNLGAILRSADAAGVDAVIVCDPLTDMYNPNLVRSSLGAIFTVPTVACSSEECIRFLKERNIKILTAQLQDSHLYYDTDMTCGTAIVMGTEATGLTDQWRKAADAHIRIPMLGQMDSLNVSVSAAILMYEAVRQRQSTRSV